MSLVDLNATARLSRDHSRTGRFSGCISKFQRGVWEDSVCERESGDLEPDHRCIRDGGEMGVHTGFNVYY